MKTHFTHTKANFRRNNTHNNIINNNNEINNIMINTMKPAYGRNEKKEQVNSTILITVNNLKI